jgi:hypothetical protein
MFFRLLKKCCPVIEALILRHRQTDEQTQPPYQALYKGKKKDCLKMKLLDKSDSYV